jgi:hypothetical protein
MRYVTGSHFEMENGSTCIEKYAKRHGRKKG